MDHNDPNTRKSGGMGMGYGRFAAMIATSTVVMFGLMYLNTYALSHVEYSQTRTWMAIVMGATMALIMIGFMWGMYPDRRANLGIVGESGSGKTTLLKLLLGLQHASTGAISFRGNPLDTSDRAFMRGFRRSVQAVFQDPYSSLDPRQRVFDIIAEPLRSLKVGADIAAAVAWLNQDCAPD